MRIVYIGQDQFLRCAEAIVQSGHSLLAIYTTQGKRPTLAARALGGRLGIPVHTSPMTRADLIRGTAGGADLFLCAGYPRLIPVAPGAHAPAVNIHPALLPEGRGAYPMAWTILKGLPESGITIHEMDERFDRGPILLQRAVTLSPRETAPSLTLRLRALAAEATAEMLADFPALWAARTAQVGGSYWKAPKPADRTIDWSASVAQVERTWRAFPGRCTATVAGRRCTVHSAIGWAASHNHAPGTVVEAWQRTKIIAAADGFVAVGARPITLQRRAWWKAMRRLRR